jgi:hypothetical protein
MVLSDMYEDDEPAVPRPPNIEMRPLAVPLGAETRERRRAWEVAAAILEDARGTTAATARTGGRVPEPTWVAPTLVLEPTRVATSATAGMLSPRTSEVLGGPTAGQGGLGRARRFRMTWQAPPLLQTLPHSSGY